MGRRRNVAEEKDFNIEKGSNGNVSSVAIHEIGHALVGLVLGICEFEKITILGRGSSLGYVEYTAQSGSMRLKSDYLRRIMISMGGRAAEELIYGKDDVSTGATSDIKHATNYATDMVTEYGFSDEIGFRSIEESGHNYLGDDHGNEITGELKDKIDAEISKILNECMKNTLDILSERKNLLIDMAEKLFNEKEVKSEDLKKMLDEWNINANN